jgi:hypothetical protein
MHSVRPLIFVAFGAAMLFAAGAVQAQVTEIFKCRDASGRPLYTSDKRDTEGKQCELVSREINVVPAQKPKPSPAPRAGQGSFPRESSSTRTDAKERQREILETELATEEELLAKARQALAAQEAVRAGDERNYARVLERLRPFQENVELHTKNVEALRRELANLYR